MPAKPTTAPEAAPPAHHAPGGGFRNPWPDSTPRTFRDAFRWARERRKQARVASPPHGSLPSTTPRLEYPRAAATEFAATWIGHSTVLLQIGGLNVITDPVFSQRAFPAQWLGPRRVMDPALSLDALPPLDIVLISHNHYDHLDKPAVKHIARAHPDAVWIVPLKLASYVRGWGARNIVEMDWWQNVEVLGMRVTCTPARHFSARRLGDTGKTLWCGYALDIAGTRAYFAGDTAYHPQFGEIGARCGPFDFIMMPIGAYDPRWFMHVIHVDPEEAVQAYVDLTAASAAQMPLMLALHWGTFRLTDEPMDEPPARAAVAWSAHGLDSSRLWVARFGETRSIISTTPGSPPRT